MKRVLLCMLVFTAAGRAEVIDKVVAIVDSHIITASDMRQERDILKRLNEKPIDDDKTLVQQLIDNYLVGTQIADFPGIEVTDPEIDEELQKSSGKQGPADSAEEAVREAVRIRLRTRKYFDERFGQFIQASDADVGKYYDEVFVPEAKKRELNPIPPLNEVASLIRTNVVREAMNHEVSIWLEAIRRRSNIEVFE